MFERTNETFVAQRTWKGYVVKKRIKNNHRKKKIKIYPFNTAVPEFGLIPDIVRPMIKIYRTGNRVVLINHIHPMCNGHYRDKRDRKVMIFNYRYEVMQKNK